MTLRKLVPDVAGNWLYKDEGENRIFSQSVYLGKDADPAEWQECTHAEKKEWEAAHPIE